MIVNTNRFIVPPAHALHLLLCITGDDVESALMALCWSFRSLRTGLSLRNTRIHAKTAALAVRLKSKL
jgi:hypothetical protein